MRTSTGLKYVQHLVRHKDAFRDATASSVRHYANIEGLRRAAAEGCGLCLLIQGEADAILAELDGLEGLMKHYSGSPPTFDMWLTKRPEGGQGFWVLSECSTSAKGAVTIPVAAFGFALAECMLESWPMLEFRHER